MTETMQWEYRVKTVGSALGTKDEEIEALLNEWGLEGWKATQVFARSQNNKVTVVARRPLTATTRRLASWPGQ